jgi:hypothetical protein
MIGGTVVICGAPDMYLNVHMFDRNVAGEFFAARFVEISHAIATFVFLPGIFIFRFMKQSPAISADILFATCRRDGSPAAVFLQLRPER